MKTNSAIPHRIILDEKAIPTAFYNLRADMPARPDPLLNPQTLKPCGPEDLYPLFCRALAEQELDDKTRFFDIPGPVMDLARCPIRSKCTLNM